MRRAVTVHDHAQLVRDGAGQLLPHGFIKMVGKLVEKFFGVGEGAGGAGRSLKGLHHMAG